MIEKYSKLIFILLSIFCSNQHLSAKDKYLPEEITDNKTFTMKIVYDDTNRINQIHTISTFSDGQKQEVNYLYEFYPNGLLKTLISKTRVQSDSVVTNMETTDKYNYQVSDTIIAIAFAKKFIVNGEIYQTDTISNSKLYLNKDQLLYKMVSIDGYDKFMTTTDTIAYNRSNDIVKTEQNIINKSGDLSFYISYEIVESVQQKNVFSDVQKSLYMQIPLERQWFYLFTDETPTLMKLKSKMQYDKDIEIKNAQFNYKLDNNGYPIEINSIEAKEDKEPKKSTLFIKYKKVNN